MRCGHTRHTAARRAVESAHPQDQDAMGDGRDRHRHRGARPGRTGADLTPEGTTMLDAMPHSALA